MGRFADRDGLKWVIVGVIADHEKTTRRRAVFGSESRLGTDVLLLCVHFRIGNCFNHDLMSRTALNLNAC